ncbi:MAG: MnhB domain-containing protein [Wenzhouxiangellaceae bacterium]|nr:MnhB domain-containing protein [Wenzhouxiangellaceae bacterium]
MKRFAVLLTVLALAAALLAGLLDLPVPGDPASAVHTHVTRDSIRAAAAHDATANLVTTVLLDFRALDTFIEVMVILSAWVAVTAVLAAGPVRDGRAPSTDAPALGPSPIVALVVRLLAPFVAAFAAFVMITGDRLPGGGFQGGVVLAAMAILLSVALGPARVARLLRPRVWPWLRALGVLVFALVGVIGLLATGGWFDVPDSGPARHAWLLALEIAIGLGGAAVLTGIFLALTDPQES